MSRSKNLLEIWDLYSKQVIIEKKAPKMSKQGPGAKNLNDMKARTVAEPKKTGPDGVDNFNGPAFNRNISDLKTMSDKDKKKKPYVAQLNVSVENFNNKMEKTTKTIINNNMKSTFDKLFEEVMGSEDAEDLNALGVDTEAMGDEGEGDAGGEITVTLSPEHVDALRAILAQIDGGGEEMDMEAETSMPDDEMGTEEDAEEKHKKKEKEEDAEEDYEEDGEMANEAQAVDAGSDLADSHGLGLTKVSSGSNKVGDKTAKLAGKGSADSKVTGKVDAGSNLPDSHGLGMTKVSSGSNVVKSKLKAGAEAYGIS
jgi:hypothetical protein